jgi:protein gp37
MNRVDWHVFQVLTKRSERLLEMASRLPWAPNIWAGVTVESNEYLARLNDLRKVPSSVKFVSFEPLLGSIETADLSGIDWVIVGGESGPGARPMKKEWVTPLRSACLSQGIPFFFKQWGGVNKKKAGRELDGRVWSQTPGSMVQ